MSSYTSASIVASKTKGYVVRALTRPTARKPLLTTHVVLFAVVATAISVSFIIRRLALRPNLVETWHASQIFLNYSHGFVRRGLIGQAFRAR